MQQSIDVSKELSNKNWMNCMLRKYFAVLLIASEFVSIGNSSEHHDGSAVKAKAQATQKDGGAIPKEDPATQKVGGAGPKEDPAAQKGGNTESEKGSATRKDGGAGPKEDPATQKDVNTTQNVDSINSLNRNLIMTVVEWIAESDVFEGITTAYAFVHVRNGAVGDVIILFNTGKDECYEGVYRYPFCHIHKVKTSEQDIFTGTVACKVGNTSVLRFLSPDVTPEFFDSIEGMIKALRDDRVKYAIVDGGFAYEFCKQNREFVKKEPISLFYSGKQGKDFALKRTIDEAMKELRIQNDELKKESHDGENSTIHKRTYIVQNSSQERTMIHINRNISVARARALHDILEWTQVLKTVQSAVILVSAKNGTIDAAVACINTKDGPKSEVCFVHQLSVIFKIGVCQDFGTAMISCPSELQQDLNLLAPKSKAKDRTEFFGTSEDALEALKKGRVQYTVMKSTLAEEFCKNNKGFCQSPLHSSYEILLKENSAIKQLIDKALGEIKNSTKKWLKGEIIDLDCSIQSF
jgi:ABC-type amino acid transport substrate-binding protein